MQGEIRRKLVTNSIHISTFYLATTAAATATITKRTTKAKTTTITATKITIMMTFQGAFLDF